METPIPIIRDALRGSRACVLLAHHLRRTRDIEGLSALDAHLSAIQSRHPLVDEACCRELRNFCYRIKNPRLPSDPFSEAYRLRIMDLYQEISGRSSYSVDFESHAYDLEKEKHDYFPFNTRSTQMVGDQLITQGLILRNIRLPVGARIVEFGAGTGNTAINLAMTGYRMTVVEVSKPSLELIRHRAAINAREMEFANMDMIDFARSGAGPFDAALFVASFHHCTDHLRLLENLGSILKKDGVIYFADEPFHLTPGPTLPHPWGLRQDGQSIWFIRKHGWFELGFQMTYIKAALARYGWKTRVIRSPLWAVPNFVMAHR